MNVPFFDAGVCGIPMTGHVGSINKDSGAESAAVVFDAAIPVGTKLVNVIAIPSEDLDGGTTISVGDGVTETAYVDGETLTAGKAAVKDQGLKDVTSEKVGVKVSAAITAGSVDVFATIIRLTA